MKDDNILKKLNRKELLEMLYEQSRKLDEKDEEIKKLSARINGRAVIVKESGSIAEAAMELNDVFKAAQDAADMYVASVKYCEGKDVKPPQNIAMLKRGLTVSKLQISKIRKSIATLDKDLEILDKLIRITEAEL